MLSKLHLNAVRVGILSSASIVTIARAGTSASKTATMGSALLKGIAGSIHEEQIITFLSDDCNSDMLILSFDVADQMRNLYNMTEYEFEATIEGLGVGNMMRDEVTAMAFSVLLTTLFGGQLCLRL
jgi:hypothetical protein